MQDVLDPEALTIGFARRFATYKRATLIFRDLPRLKRILTHPTRPVQLVMAGKAHPQDIPGKTLIREIVEFSRDPELAGRVIFVEDYGIQVARELVGGVDIWLNTPRRGEEASGTSGMKAGMNGALNVSILDGWFDEAEDAAGGWAIGNRETYSPDRDDAHAAGIYSALENEIVPLYYQRDQGVPEEWMRRVKRSLRQLSANFNSQRMVDEYRAQLYDPAHRAFQVVSEDRFKAARDRVRWGRVVAENWPRVRFISCSIDAETVSTGLPIALRAEVDLAGLKPDDVRVEALVGRVGPEGELEEVQVLVLEPRETPRPQQGGVFLFGRDTRAVRHRKTRIFGSNRSQPLRRPD